MSTSPDERAAAIAVTQGCALSRAQARAVGLTDAMISHRVAGGRWTLLHPGVYGIAGAPPSWERALWAAHLAAGPATVVSHDTALLVRGVDDRHVPRHPLRLIGRHGAHHRVRGAVVHQIDDLAPHHVDRVDGLATTTPARSIVDIAAIAGAKRLGDLVDIVTDRLTSVAHISACMADVARPGKRGLSRLGRVLDERGPGYVPPQSELESVMFTALATSGLPAPRRQFPLPGRGAVEGTVDAAYLDERVILEADGRRWHTRIRQLRRDHERDAEAARAGWQTLRLLYEQLIESPADQAAVVADVLAVRSVQLRRSAG
jgi:very-short-patch-repair endonuclease